MKKGLTLLGILCLVALLGTGFTVWNVRREGGPGEAAGEQDEFLVVASFYPVYIAALNVADGIDGVRVENMTEQKGGCLHDYQITTADMKKLERADAFLINGAGMESFLGQVRESYPDLTVIDASEGIPSLEGTGTEPNGHLWMSPEKYGRQVRNIAEGLMEADPGNRDRYRANEEAYERKVEGLLEETREFPGKEEGVVIFHDSFAYLAECLPLRIVHQAMIEEDSVPSAGEVAEIIEEVRESRVSLLLAERQFSEEIPRRIARETGARVLVLDSLVSGEADKDAYLRGMEENLKALEEAIEG